MLNQLFATQTFCDHASEPSFGRKACFWILLSMGILAVLSLCFIAFGPVTTGKQVATFTLDLIKAGVTLCGLFYGAAQVSKGMAQMGGNKGQLPTTAPIDGALSVPATQTVPPITPPITPPMPTAKLIKLNPPPASLPAPANTANKPPILDPANVAALAMIASEAKPNTT